MIVVLSAFCRRLLASTALLCCLFAGSGALVDASGSRSNPPKAHAASTYLVGVADEQTEVFKDPLWQQLHTRIIRYIVPYDAVAHPASIGEATTWIRTAEAHRQQVLVAFYHSEYDPTYMPTAAQYAHYVKKFIKRFPHVHQYEPWNEANRGNVRYEGEEYDSPTPTQAASYYVELLQACPGCNIVALDILDQPNVAPSLEYISQFKAQLGRWRVPTPSIWGLHNYSDTNRFSSTRTRAVLAAVPGQVWLTETGGIVKFGSDFPNYGGSGLTRAANAISYMFTLASSNSRIKRLYIYQWSGGTASAIFDAGLTDYHHKPRPGYVIVCRHMHAAKCNVKVSSQ